MKQITVRIRPELDSEEAVYEACEMFSAYEIGATSFRYVGPQDSRGSWLVTLELGERDQRAEMCEGDRYFELDVSEVEGIYFAGQEIETRYGSRAFVARVFRESGGPIMVETTTGRVMTASATQRYSSKIRRGQTGRVAQ